MNMQHGRDGVFRYQTIPLHGIVELLFQIHYHGSLRWVDGLNHFSGRHISAILSLTVGAGDPLVESGILCVVGSRRWCASSQQNMAGPVPVLSGTVAVPLAAALATMTPTKPRKRCLLGVHY
jgi:hypothetical protein